MTGDIAHIAQSCHQAIGQGLLHRQVVVLRVRLLDVGIRRMEAGRGNEVLKTIGKLR